MWLLGHRTDPKEATVPAHFQRALEQVNGVEVDLNPVLKPAEQKQLVAEHAQWARQQYHQARISHQVRASVRSAAATSASHPY
jgi:hypothetical protein